MIYHSSRNEFVVAMLLFTGIINVISYCFSTLMSHSMQIEASLPPPQSSNDVFLKHIMRVRQSLHRSAPPPPRVEGAGTSTRRTRGLARYHFRLQNTARRNSTPFFFLRKRRGFVIADPIINKITVSIYKAVRYKPHMG